MSLLRIFAWTAGFAAAVWGLLIGLIALTIEPAAGFAIILVSLSISRKLF